MKSSSSSRVIFKSPYALLSMDWVSLYSIVFAHFSLISSFSWSSGLWSIASRRSRSWRRRLRSIRSPRCMASVLQLSSKIRLM